MQQWRPDVLGDGFDQLTLPLGTDAEGELVATLVRALPKPISFWERLTASRSHPFEGIDVLYVHGWSDYFFQRELADFWTARGARFFALDLRKYGRSLRPGQTPGYIEHLDDYDQEIGAAIAAIGADGATGGRELMLLGHSTGGLVLSLWAARNPGVASALILNSPWLEFQLSAAMRKVISPIVDLGTCLNPYDAAPQIDFGFYTRAQQEVAPAAQRPDINEEWRPPLAMPVRAAWMRAVLEGHQRIERGLDIAAPVCVLLSKRWMLSTKWSDEMTSADTVLAVDEIAKAALHLGDAVTINRIDGALHDVFLSRQEPRREAYARMERWVLGLRATR